MRASVVLAAVVACGAPPAPVLPPPPSVPDAPPEPPPPAPPPCADCGTVTGRVLLNGAPVGSFGVIVAKSFASPYRTSFAKVRDPDGRFALTDAKPGTWDLVIVGPGIGKLVIPQQDVTAGGRLDLGDLAASPGFTVDGTVVDANGAGVGNAAVVLVQAAWEMAGDAIDLARAGNHVVATDSAGHFSIGGVAPRDIGGGLTAYAFADGIGATPEKYLRFQSQTITLTLGPGCTVGGTVAKSRLERSPAIVIADHERAVPIVRGRYRMTLPANGHYKLSAPGHAGEQVIDCTPGAVVEASFKD